MPTKGNQIRLRNHPSHRVQAFDVFGSWAPAWVYGDVLSVRLTGDTTIAAVVMGRYGPTPGAELLLVLTQDGTGGHSVTWDSSYWGAPVVGEGANQVTVARFVNISTTVTPVWRQASTSTVTIARVYKAGSATIPTGTWTAIPFDGERWDSNRFHDNAVNNSRLTIPATGYWKVGGCARFAADAAGTIRGWAIVVNGTTFIAMDQSASSAIALTRTLNTEWLFAAGDYVELKVFHDKGSNSTVDVLPGSSPEMWISPAL